MVWIVKHGCPGSSWAVFLALLSAVSPASAQHAPRSAVAPVVHEGIKYSAPHFLPGKQQNGGFLQAHDEATGKLLWEVQVYETDYDDQRARDAQDVFIVSLRLSESGDVLVENEYGDRYEIDTGSHAVLRLSGTRTFLLVLVVGFPLLGLVALYLSWKQLSAFLGSVPMIRTKQDLDRLRSVVKNQMILALGQIAVLAVPVLAFLIGFVLRFLATLDLLYLVVPVVAFLGAALVVRRSEGRVKAMLVRDEKLLDAYEKIIRTWKRRALPDW